MSQDIRTLIEKGKIQCKIWGNHESVHYAQPLLIEITNRTPENLSIKIPAGYIFKPNDSAYQDIIVTQTLIAAIPPKQTKQFKLFGMCLEQNQSAPLSEISYSPFGMAESKLITLAEYIEKNRFFSPAGQNTIWAFVDDLPLYTVTSYDTTQANQLRQFLSQLTGKPITPVPEDEAYRYLYHLKPAHYVVEGEIEFEMNRRIKVEWALFNENGILVREFYNGYLEPGEQKLTFSYDASVYYEPVYYVKLVTDGIVMYNEKITFSDQR